MVSNQSNDEENDVVAVSDNYGAYVSVKSGTVNYERHSHQGVTNAPNFG